MKSKLASCLTALALVLGTGLSAHAAGKGGGVGRETAPGQVKGQVPWKPTTGITCQNSAPGKGGVINAKALEFTRATRLYRLYGGVSTKMGGWWTDTRYTKSEATRRALAVCKAWPDGGESPMSYSVTCTAAVGLKFCRGTTQSADCKDPAAGYPKGPATQIFIPGSERGKLKCY